LPFFETPAVIVNHNHHTTKLIVSDKPRLIIAVGALEEEPLLATIDDTFKMDSKYNKEVRATQKTNIRITAHVMFGSQRRMKQ